MSIDLTLRGVKNLPLSYQEVDANFVALKDAINASTSATDVLLTGYVTTATSQSITGTKKFRGVQETVYEWGTTSGTIVPDASSGTIQTITLNGNITLSTLTNLVVGQSMMIKVKQDATGNRTLSSSMKFAGGSKILTTASNAIDVINIVYDGTDLLASLVKGFV
jgi:hypothetical protein